MSEGALSQPEIDAMLATAAADGAEALGPRPVRGTRGAASASSVEELFATPIVHGQPDSETGGAYGGPAVAEDESDEPRPRPNIVSLRPEPLELVDRTAMEAIERRLDSLEDVLGTLRGDSVEARRVNEQVRALQAQVSSLDGEVRVLQKRIDLVDRRLAAIQQRPARRPRRSLWSTSLYVDAAEHGRWSTGGR